MRHLIYVGAQKYGILYHREKDGFPSIGITMTEKACVPKAGEPFCMLSSPRKEILVRERFDETTTTYHWKYFS